MPYSAPGKIDELTPQQLEKWNDTLASIFENEIGNAKRESTPDSPIAWIYNPINNGGGTPATKDIEWTAFPKTISDNAPTPEIGWQFADKSRDNQEEYCEWEVAQIGTKIDRVTFTCETEDYYAFLAHEAPEMLLALYHKHVSPQVKLSDLIVDGGYKPQNKWNYPQLAGARGIIMHMAQTNNSFGAAVNLSAVASWPRVDEAGNPITGEQPLIACREFGVPGRHSDPHIGAQVNEFVRGGNEISFADPIGLYIHQIDTSEWKTPDGKPASDWIHVVRGTAEYRLRVVVRAPNGSPFTVSDLKISGKNVRFGGQIAEKIRIRIRAMARKAASPAPSLKCTGETAGLTIHSTGEVPANYGKIVRARSRLADRINLISPE